MHLAITRLAVIAIATVIAATATQAAIVQHAPDLPILVDRYYAIKDPAGPVTRDAGQLGYGYSTELPSGVGPGYEEPTPITTPQFEFEMLHN